MRLLPNVQEHFEHLFLECSTVTPVWKYVGDLIKRRTGVNVKSTVELCLKCKFPNNVTLHTDLLVLLYAIPKHSIWKARNSILFDHKTINHTGITQMIKRSIRYRSTCEKPKPDSAYEETLDKLCTLL